MIVQLIHGSMRFQIGLQLASSGLEKGEVSPSCTPTLAQT